MGYGSSDFRTRYRDCRYQVHRLFEVGAGGKLGWYIDTAIVVLIISNVIAVVLETVDPIYAAFGHEFYLFEVVSVTIFAVEYAGRLWVAVEYPKYAHPIWGRLRYATSMYMILDFLAIIPFFIGIVTDTRFLRLVRLLRFLRLLKLARYSTTIQLFGRVISRKKDDLVVTFLVGGLMLLLTSSLMYFVERSAQPEEFSSIPAAMWWAVVTLTTVGYGDVHPITPGGRLIGAVAAVIGIGLFALPSSILASGFIEEWSGEDGELHHCPGCGEDLQKYRE